MSSANDLISRQALCEYALNQKDKSVTPNDIMRFPPARLERKTGEWYKPTGMMPPEFVGVYRCSECDEPAMRDWKTRKQKLTGFCPNCGADMRMRTAKQIIHDAIDNTPMAEDIYVGIKEKLHKAVDEV